MKTWRDQAACRGMDAALFFPDKADSAAPALAACAACAVQTECRDHAMDEREGIGIWGGTRGRERQLIWRKQDRERRKADAAGL
jgi:WhiB family redox-sensing transcriptional regulator